MNKNYKEGIDFVFEQNQDLAKIGTKEQYEKYLETIFPDSKVKNIFFHGSRYKKNFEKFNLKFGGRVGKNFGKGIYGISSFYKAKQYANGKNPLAIVLNIKDPFITDNKYADYYGAFMTLDSKSMKEFINNDSILNYNRLDRDKLKAINKYLVEYVGEKDEKGFPKYQEEIFTYPKIEEVVVPNPSQVRILGSKKDKKDFYKFVHGNRKDSLEKIISGLFILSFLAGLFFLSPNLTGNIIGTSETAHRLIGIILTLLGISGFFDAKNYLNKILNIT